jgi:regulator of sigma E protease
MAEFAGQSASLGLTPYLSYLAFMSLSLTVFNLLPVPLLDGGHLLYYLYEAFTGHPPAAQWLDVMQHVGLLFLMGLMFFSSFNDLVRLGWIN